MATLLDDSRPNITVTNTATETPVYTVTIPGGTLGTNKAIYAKLVGMKVKNGGGSEGAQLIRVSYGSTLLAQFQPENVTGDSALGISLVLDICLAAKGATNAQTAHVTLIAHRDAFTPGSSDQPTTTVRHAGATLAEDSTGDLDLEVTWQQAAVSQHSFTSEHGTVVVA